MAHTHTERNKCDKTHGHIVILGPGDVDCTGWQRVDTDLACVCVIAGTAHPESLKSLAEALCMHKLYYIYIYINMNRGSVYV